MLNRGTRKAPARAIETRERSCTENPHSRISLKRRSSRERSGSIWRTHRGLSPSATSPQMRAMNTRSPLLSNGTLMKTSRAVLDVRGTRDARRDRRAARGEMPSQRGRAGFLRPERDFREPPADLVEPLLAFLELASDLRATTVFPDVPTRVPTLPVAPVAFNLPERLRPPGAGDLNDHATIFWTRSTSANVAPYFSAVSGTLSVCPPRMMSFLDIPM